MNASPVSATTAVNPALSRRAKASGGRWTYSVTFVCFLFGALLASQLRAYNRIQQNESKNLAGAAAVQKQAADALKEAGVAKAENARLQADLNNLKASLGQGKTLTAKQIQSLNARIKDLQAVAGLTPVTGPGVRIVLSDNAGVAAASGGMGDTLPGIVHDFDVLQVVNELRSAKADAIAVNGTRVTGYTPIRCVGPAILVNWDAVTAPFVIEAVGNAKALQSALAMPNGIVDNLRNRGFINVKISTVKSLALPESGTVPTFKVAHAGP